ncbi:MAG: capsular biosynthesis protein [Bacteroidetes bacterium]|nr:DegT/DnrJ/EryC1/StrS family aminotransferase [Bacteroidia bacterium]PCH66153.1 MAG: capsular biosynthesis protein [Bacteroidota bacterium]
MTKNKLPFYKPRTDEKIIEEVADTIRSGWFTTGPKTKRFEKEIAKYVGIDHVLCVNAATSGLELMLRWFGIKEGDEVIVPVYTYCATANVVVRCGAKPVMVDIRDDFNIDVSKIKAAITEKTKVIIPVDIAGFPCDYDEIMELINKSEVKGKFKSETEEQEKLGRILVLSDAAHSFGGLFSENKIGSLTDITVFSFHAVKNLTTGEGGAICLNLPNQFDNAELYQIHNTNILHGQSSDALEKNKINKWNYDVKSAGYKFNMTDVQACFGLVELKRYEQENLPMRKSIFHNYDSAFTSFEWAQLPEYNTSSKSSSMHYYALRIKNISEDRRNQIIDLIFNQGINVNVHFKPLPMLTFYKNLGYKMNDFPVAYDNYCREISLPVYFDLTEEQQQQIIDAVISSVNEVI